MKSKPRKCPRCGSHLLYGPRYGKNIGMSWFCQDDDCGLLQINKERNIIIKVGPYLVYLYENKSKIYLPLCDDLPYRLRDKIEFNRRLSPLITKEKIESLLMLR